MPAKPKPHPTPDELRRRAEKDSASRKLETPLPRTEMDTQRLLHELQVHQIELEMQNAELGLARDEADLAREKYSDLYDFAPVGYFTILADGTIRLVNLAGATLVGMVRSRLVGRSFEMLVSPAHRPAFNAFLAQVFARDTASSIESELIHQGHPERFVTINVQLSPDGQECSMSVTDISARKRDEDALRTSEIRYRRLFEAAHDGVLLMDPATRKITDANPYMTKLLDYPHADLVGKELFEIGLLKDEAASQEMFQKLKQTREVRYEDLPLETQGGRHQEVEVVANLYQEDGKSVIQCNIRDITERKQAENAQRNLAVMTASNVKLKQEIIRRQAVEEALRQTQAEETRLLNESRDQQHRLRDLSHQILHVQEAERKRISRELYDVIAQTLVGMNVHVTSLSREADEQPDSLRDSISKTHHMVEESLEIVHQFAHELRPTMLDDLGLIPALQHSLGNFMEETGIRVSLKAFAGIEKAPEIVRTAFYRIAQEALVNVAKHAKASAVEILIQSLDGSISMEISDNGQGFEVNKNQASKKKGQLGLIGMRERAEMIGADFSVASAPGAPTTIRITVKSPRARKQTVKKSPTPRP